MGQLTVERFMSTVLADGRNSGPEKLYDAWLDRALSNEVLTIVTPRVWSLAEYPQDALDEDCWEGIFGDVEYTVDGSAAKPPDSITLFRGCAPELSGRWSWTSNRAVALKFADGMYGRLPGIVHVAEVPGYRLRFFDNSRNESEYVIDTESLEIMGIL